MMEGGGLSSSSFPPPMATSGMGAVRRAIRFTGSLRWQEFPRRIYSCFRQWVLGHHSGMTDSATTHKSLVLVLGAGASAELKFPVGDKLKDEIAAALHFIVQYGHQRNMDYGDSTIWQALTALGRAPDGNIRELNELLVRARHVHDAMPLATSIDNFIDCHREDQRIATCGKLGIVQRILEAERSSLLFVDPTNTNSTIKFLDTRETWFNSFFRVLVENCQSKDIEARLQTVGVVTFNYDRSLEHFLHHALRIYYRESSDWAANALKSLDIFHPYGVVGPLPWMGGAGTVQYGSEIGHIELLEAAKKILTFSEGTNADESRIKSIRQMMAQTKRIAFLGFAYHPLNMEVLFGGIREAPSPGDSRTVLGTAFGVSDSDVAAIKDDYTLRTKRRRDRVTLSQVKCAQLLAENQRSLSLVR